MKKTLTEELQRIHEITYGKQVVNEGFIDKLLSKKPEGKTFTHVLQNLEYGSNKQGISYVKGKSSLYSIINNWFTNKFAS